MADEQAPRYKCGCGCPAPFFKSQMVDEYGKWAVYSQYLILGQLILFVGEVACEIVELISWQDGALIFGIIFLIIAAILFLLFMVTGFRALLLRQSGRLIFWLSVEIIGLFFTIILIVAMVFVLVSFQSPKYIWYMAASPVLAILEALNIFTVSRARNILLREIHGRQAARDAEYDEEDDRRHRRRGRRNRDGGYSVPVVVVEVTQAEMDAADQETRDDANGKCVICYERKREALLLECGHKTTCLPCTRCIGHCPVCRAPIDQIVHQVLKESDDEDGERSGSESKKGKKKKGAGKKKGKKGGKKGGAKAKAQPTRTPDDSEDDLTVPVTESDSEDRPRRRAPPDSSE